LFPALLLGAALPLPGPLFPGLALPPLGREEGGRSSYVLRLAFELPPLVALLGFSPLGGCPALLEEDGRSSYVLRLAFELPPPVALLGFSPLGGCPALLGVAGLFPMLAGWPAGLPEPDPPGTTDLFTAFPPLFGGWAGLLLCTFCGAPGLDGGAILTSGRAV